MKRLLVAVLLAACGSQPNVNDYAQKCATPRTGINPSTQKPFPDKQGTLDDEKTFLRLWSDMLYLWYREIPSSDPKQFTTAIDYFAVLKTPAKTPSGKDKDQFHFTYPSDKWQQLSQAGTASGYGMTLSILQASPPNRDVRIAYVEPGSPAAAAGLDHGTQIMAVDGARMADGSADVINAGLIPATTGQTHSFSVLDRGATTERTVSMQSATVTIHPVNFKTIISTATGAVGYMLFNDHEAQAEHELIDAFNFLSTPGVTDLVLDMRYNGGGLVDVAAETAFMIAGPGPTTGKTFERTVFNDKYPNYDPVEGKAVVPEAFLSKAVGWSAAAGTPLPSLNLPRVYIIMSGGTCSASESVINGLRGVGVTVYGIGSTTCGKPYGFYPWDNCGTTYFSIMFKGANEQGFGDYADGFVPGGSGDTGLPGCVVPEDWSHALGDPAEGRLAAALALRANGACPATARRADQLPFEGRVVKDLWHTNRWLR